MNVNEIIEAFFDLDKSCPSEILECDKIRERYKSELDKLTQEGCSQCKKNGVKAKFMEEVWKVAIQHLTKQ